MLKSLTIDNFQAHEHTVLDFDPGVNVLVGTSDSGKTACLRGLFWVRNNRPLGKGFIRHGAQSVEVAIKVSGPTGDREVKRHRDNKEDYYEVGGERHTALRGDVPQVVTDTLGLADICIQRQMDLHFLIFDSPGHVAAALNAVTHLEDADAASATLRRQGVSLAGEVKDLQTAAETLKGRLAPYDILDGLLVAVDGLQDLATRLDAAGERAARLLDKIDRLVEADDALARTPVTPALDTVFAMVEATATKVESAQQLYGRLNRLWHNLKDVDAQRASQVELKVEQETLLLVESLAEEGYQLRTRVTKLHVLVHDLKQLVGGAAALDQHMQIAVQTRDEASAQLTECPTCGQPVVGEAHEHVLRELAR